MQLIKKIYTNKRGDTIIEVMLAIAILSLVLSASYVLANRSSQAVRQSQERTEALKFSEEQLERLRDYVDIDTDWATFQSGCFSQTMPSEPIVPVVPDSLTPTICSFGPDDRYLMEITATNNTYTLTASWDNVAGEGRDQIQLSYRLPSVAFAETPPPVPQALPSNTSPVAAFTANVSGLDVTFTDTSTDLDSDPLTYFWEFGDGAESTDQNPTHTYTTNGIQSVSLTVDDGNGGTNTFTDTVNITIVSWDQTGVGFTTCFGGSFFGGTWPCTTVFSQWAGVEYYFFSNSFNATYNIESDELTPNGGSFVPGETEATLRYYYVGPTTNIYLTARDSANNAISMDYTLPADDGTQFHELNIDNFDISSLANPPQIFEIRVDTNGQLFAIDNIRLFRD